MRPVGQGSLSWRTCDASPGRRGPQRRATNERPPSASSRQRVRDRYFAHMLKPFLGLISMLPTAVVIHTYPPHVMAEVPRSPS